MKRDGHIHTPFCPHGTKDQLEEYIEKAIHLGFTEISFTEHAPLPHGFEDPTPLQDSAMKLSELPLYIEEINKLKTLYENKITIHCGLEVDFVEGFEKETRDFLNTYGPLLDDSILSVHFLQHGSTYDCVDYSPDGFEEMIRKYGSSERIYEKYFHTVKKSILADLGPYKPKRMGHITLVKKFQRKFPVENEFRMEILEILDEIKAKNYLLDYNGAGTRKPLCLEPYPPEWVVLEAKKRSIPLIYGSDAHQVKELQQGYEELIL